MSTYIDALPKELRLELKFYNNYVFWYLANRFLKTFYMVYHFNHDIDNGLLTLEASLMQLMTNRVNMKNCSMYNDDGYYVLYLQIANSELINSSVLLEICNVKLGEYIQGGREFRLYIPDIFTELQLYNAYLIENNYNKQLILHPAPKCWKISLIDIAQ